jgi:hypothetical protein
MNRIAKESQSVVRKDYSNIRRFGYWSTTAVIAIQVAAGAYLDLTKNPAFSEIAEHLGYPVYLLSILGVLRLFALPALLAPGFRRIKEWAYAGLFFEYGLALASHIAVGDKASTWLWPFLFIVFLLTSWVLRPSGRKF